MGETSAVGGEKLEFIRRLDESRGKTTAALATVDPELVIYQESGWRIKDLIAHLAAWENQVVLSLRAYAVGNAYTIPEFTSDDAYNEQIFRQYRNVAIEDIQALWKNTRADFKAAIQAVPAEHFDGQVLCPWGLLSPIRGIVDDMIQHEANHLRDILNSL